MSYAQETTAATSISFDWRPFAVAYSSSFSRVSRFAACSFEDSPESCNFLHLYRVVGPSFVSDGSARLKMPQTSCIFNPIGSQADCDDLITVGDQLRVWRADSGRAELRDAINVNETSDPITCIDWSIYEEALVIVGSTSAMATAVDLYSGQTAARIIAHDHPIHDISFCGGSSNFVTAGFDGSIRFFDLRDLQTSFIYYQTSMPLMRVEISPTDSFMIATFAKDSSSATIIDARKPGVPYAVSNRNKAPISCIKWSKIQNNIIYTSDFSGAFVQSMAIDDVLEMESDVLLNVNKPIESFTLGEDVIALAIENRVDFYERKIVKNLQQFPKSSYL